MARVFNENFNTSERRGIQQATGDVVALKNIGSVSPNGALDHIRSRPSFEMRGQAIERGGRDAVKNKE